MLWRPRVGCAAMREGAGKGSGRGARRRLPRFGRGPRRPSTCALCIVPRGRRGEGRGSSLGSGGGAGRGLPRGRGLADTAAGVPAKAVGEDRKSVV